MKDTDPEFSAAEYIWIGTVTRPKEIDAEAIGLAAIVILNVSGLPGRGKKISRKSVRGEPGPASDNG